MFNITEDQSIDDHETKDTRHFDDHTSLLYSPLPKHLPNVKKNLLINAAASEGNVDRYCRLKRPFGKMGGSHEIPALVRGVYHHPFFAKWCSLQPEFLKCEEIQNAITARYIMSNDVSRVTAETDVCQIWYPSWASSDTYREVLRRAPVTMRDTIARAAIVTDHYSLFDAADPDPSNIYIGIEASESPNPYYYQALQTKAEDQEKIFMDERASEFSRLNVSTTRWIRMSRDTRAQKDIQDMEGGSRGQGCCSTLYEGTNFGLESIEQSVITSDEVKYHERFKNVDWFDPTALYPDSDPWDGNEIEPDPEWLKDL